MTTTTTAAPDIESLVTDYYVDSSRFIHYDDDGKKQQWKNEYEDNDDGCGSFSYRYCDICRLNRADWLKYYCYSNKGLNRQLITICIKCLDKYNQIDHKQRLQRLLLKQQQFVAENNNNACLNNNNNDRNRKCKVTIGGIIDIKTADKTRNHIMLTLKLAINTNKKKNSVATTTASNFDADDASDDHLFYDAVRMAYDQSGDVRRYFRNNPSRINPQNKGLWPLRYQSYKQFGL
jgi:hypothetical protein